MTTRITTENITDGTIAAGDLSNLPNLIDWQAVVSSDTTMVAGRGYFVDSSGGTKTMTLPASPSIGDTVAVHALDGATNAVTIDRNSSNIEGGTSNLSMDSNYSAVTLIYSDASNGWVRHNNEVADTFVAATGGTESTSGNYKIHTFNSSSNFVVSSLSNIATNNELSYLVVAGGGGGGNGKSGGGGAGGFREKKGGADTYTASPLDGSTSITATASTYPITVGAGGAGSPQPNTPGNAPKGSNGGSSIFSTVTSAGGGGGGSVDPGNKNGNDGGSGGGGSQYGGAGTGGSGNTPPVSPSQGFPGGIGHEPGAGGGGGGATAAGTNATPSSPQAIAGDGGAGATTSINGSATAFAGGGGGGMASCSPAPDPTGLGSGGAGGGGVGTNTDLPRSADGTANTGGGGGGSSGPTSGPHSIVGGAGGSGVVIIRYKYQG
jgi:hypothetical protein